MRQSPPFVARPCAGCVMIGRVTNNMIKTTRQNGWHFGNIIAQNTKPVIKTIGRDIPLRQCRHHWINLNRGDLHRIKPPCQTQADPANPCPHIQNTATINPNRRRQKHRIRANAKPAFWLHNRHGFAKQMIMCYRQIIKTIRRCAIAGFGIISNCRILAHVFVTHNRGWLGWLCCQPPDKRP